MTKFKLIRVHEETHYMLKELIRLSNTKSFDELLRHGSGVLFEWANELYSRREWARINEEENRVPFSQFSATE